MMRITINKNATGLVKYFTNSLSKDDYFFSGKSIPGRWHGKLRDELGLGSEVSKKIFSAIAHNKNIKTGGQLTPGRMEVRRSSYEYTFSAPKSVSILMALADQRTGREILNAHRRAVKKAMAEIEAAMQTQTRIHGRNAYATTGNILYARFDHFTSRPVKEDEHPLAKYSSDMNLHSHCVVMNCTKYGDRLQAIEASTIHREAKYYDRVYHNTLALEKQTMRCPVERLAGR